MTILQNLFLEIAMSFVNDIEVKELYTNYNNAKIFLKIRRYV